MSDNKCKPCKSETLNYFNHDGNYYVDCKSKNKIYRCIYDVKMLPVNNDKKVKELNNELKNLNNKYSKEIELLKNNFEKRLKTKNNKELINKKNNINKNLEILSNKINEVKSNLNYLKKKKFNAVISKKIKKDVNLTFNVKEKPKRIIKKKKSKQTVQKKQINQNKQKKEIKKKKTVKSTKKPKKKKLNKMSKKSLKKKK